MNSADITGMCAPPETRPPGPAAFKERSFIRVGSERELRRRRLIPDQNSLVIIDPYRTVGQTSGFRRVSTLGVSNRSITGYSEALVFQLSLL